MLLNDLFPISPNVREALQLASDIGVFYFSWEIPQPDGPSEVMEVSIEGPLITVARYSNDMLMNKLRVSREQLPQLLQFENALLHDLFPLDVNMIQSLRAIYRDLSLSWKLPDDTHIEINIVGLVVTLVRYENSIPLNKLCLSREQFSELLYSMYNQDIRQKDNLEPTHISLARQQLSETIGII
ncbi:MAG: hypothetical protein ACK518_00475 [bacterium]|jgi:hypothetical protein